MVISTVFFYDYMSYETNKNVCSMFVILYNISQHNYSLVHLNVTLENIYNNK